MACATVLGFCRPLLATPLPWATAGGALLGFIGAGLLRAGTTRRSATLLTAAFLAAVYPIFRLLLEPFGQSTGPDAALKFDIILTAQLVAAALAGVAIGARSRRLWLSVAVFVLVYSLPWTYTVRFWLAERPPHPFMFQVEWQMLIPLLNALALLTAAILARMVVSLRRVGRAGPATDP